MATKQNFIHMPRLISEDQFQNLYHCLQEDVASTVLVMSEFNQSCVMSFKCVSKSTSFSCSLLVTRPDTNCRVEAPPSNILAQPEE